MKLDCDKWNPTLTLTVLEYCILFFLSTRLKYCYLLLKKYNLFVQIKRLESSIILFHWLVFTYSGKEWSEPWVIWQNKPYPYMCAYIFIYILILLWREIYIYCHKNMRDISGQYCLDIPFMIYVESSASITSRRNKTWVKILIENIVEKGEIYRFNQEAALYGR